MNPVALLASVGVALLAVTIRVWRPFLVHWYRRWQEGLLWALTRFLERGFARRLALKRYCRLELARAETKYLTLPGGFDKAPETDTAFVPLLLDEGSRGQVVFSHETIIGAAPRLRIIGDPGSGKSSLVKRLHRDACQLALSEPRTAHLPVRIELRDFAPPHDLAIDPAEWALDQVRQRVVHSTAPDMGACFDSYSTDAGLLLLLDGLDEVPTNAYTQTLAVIKALSRRLEQMSEKTVVLITMRTQFHVQAGTDLAEVFPPVFHIQPLSPDDIFRFLAQWPFDSPETALADANRIYAQLIDRPTLRELCTNPLVLAMYVATDEQVTSAVDLPETRARFYYAVVTELLIKRRGRQVGPQPLPLAVRHRREAILGELAFRHLLDPEQPANSLQWDDAVEIVRSTLPPTEADNAERYLRDLSRETGLFTEERAGESLRFIHLTFCEFFAALEAAQRRMGGWDDLVSAHNAFNEMPEGHAPARLAEVIPFAVGLLPPKEVDSALAEIAGLGQAELFCRSVLETQRYDHPSWEHFIGSETATLLRESPSGWDEEWLKRLHLFSVALREAERWQTFSTRGGPELRATAFFEELVAQDSRRLVRLFSAFAVQDPSASFLLAESCGVNLLEERPDLLVDNAFDPAFLSLLVERAKGSDARSAWPVVLGEAARRFQNAARTLSHIAPFSQWEDAASSLPRWARWDQVQRKRTLLGTSIALACRDNVGGSIITIYPLIGILNYVGSPSLALRRTGAAVASLLLGTLVIGTGGVVLLDPRPAGGSALLIAACVAACTGLVVVRLLVRARAHLDEMALNLAGGGSPRSLWGTASRVLTLSEKVRIQWAGGAEEPVRYIIRRNLAGGIRVERLDGRFVATSRGRAGAFAVSTTGVSRVGEPRSAKATRVGPLGAERPGRTVLESAARQLALDVRGIPYLRTKDSWEVVSTRGLRRVRTKLSLDGRREIQSSTVSSSRFAWLSSVVRPRAEEMRTHERARAFMDHV